MAGATRIITTEIFSSDLLLRFIEKYRVSIIISPPSQAGLVLQNSKTKTTDFTSMRLYMTGGSVVPLTYQMQINELLKNGRNIVAYGMTEICGMATATNEYFHKYGTVGQVVPGVFIKVRPNNS